MTVQEMLAQQMNHFIKKTVGQDGTISLNKVIEIGGYIGAYTIRTRHIQQGQVSNDEIELVIGTIGNFCHDHFTTQFLQEDFDHLKSRILELLKDPTFDASVKEYFAKFYS